MSKEIMHSYYINLLHNSMKCRLKVIVHTVEIYNGSIPTTRPEAVGLRA